MNLLEIIYAYRPLVNAGEPSDIMKKIQDSLEGVFILAVEFEDICCEIYRVRTEFKHLYEMQHTSNEHHLLFSRTVFARFLGSRCLAKFLLKIFARALLKSSRNKKQKIVKASVLKDLYLQMAWLVEILRKRFMRDPRVVKSFICSQNFGLFVRIMALFEGVFSSKKSFWSEREFLKYENIWIHFNKFIEHFVVGLYRLKHPEHMRLVQQSLLEAITVTEWLCKSFDSHAPKNRKSQHRLSMNTKLYSLTVFITTFTSFDKKEFTYVAPTYNALRRPRKQTAEQKQALQRTKEILTFLVDNLIYIVKCLCDSSDLLVVNFSIAYSLYDASIVIVKSLLRKSPDLHGLVCKRIITALSKHLLSPVSTELNLSIAKGLFELLYLVCLDELTLEKFFVCIGHELHKRGDVQTPKTTLVTLINQCQSILTLAQTHALLDGSLSFDRFAQNVQINIFNRNDSMQCYYVKHVMMEQYCCFDFDTGKPKIRGVHSGIDRVELFRNLLDFDDEMLNQIVERNAGNPRLVTTPRALFVPAHTRGSPQFGKFIEFVLGKLLNLLGSFRKVLCKPPKPENESPEAAGRNAVLGKMGLTVRSVTAVMGAVDPEALPRETISKFVQSQTQLYHDQPQVMRVLEPISSFLEKPADDSSMAALVESEPAPNKNRLKRRQKKLFKKIFRKIGKTPKRAKPLAPAAKCVVCQEAFDSITESYMIAKFVKKNTLPLVTGRTDASLQKKFRIFETCGHHYHYKCLPISDYYRGIQCHYCRVKGQIFMWGQSMLRGPAGSEQSESTVQERHEQMLIQLKVIGENKANPSEADSEMNAFDKLVMPIIQPLRMVNTFNPDIFARKFLPCIRRLVNCVYNLLTTDSSLSYLIVNACRQYVAELLRPYESFGDADKLAKLFCLRQPKYRVCVEDVLIRWFVCSHLDSMLLAISQHKLSKSPENISVGQLADRQVQEMLAKFLPWFLMLKQLQVGRKTLESPSSSDVRQCVPEFVKVLNVLSAVVKLDHVEPVSGDVPAYLQGRSGGIKVLFG